MMKIKSDEMDEMIDAIINMSKNTNMLNNEKQSQLKRNVVKKASFTEINVGTK